MSTNDLHCVTRERDVAGDRLIPVHSKHLRLGANLCLLCTKCEGGSRNLAGGTISSFCYIYVPMSPCRLVA